MENFTNDRLKEASQSAAVSSDLPSPAVIFLASAFVGLVAGPRLVSVGRELLESKSREIAALAVDRFMESLRANGAPDEIIKQEKII